MSDERVLIAGGGPIAAVTGFCLARAGIPVMLFDREPFHPEDHRAATLQPSTLDLFEPLGITREIMKQALVSRHFQWRDRVKDEVVAQFDYEVLAPECHFPFVAQLEQHKTVNIVLAAAEKLDTFKIERLVEVVGARQTEDHVELEVRRPDGSTEMHRGRYLVGADGGRSVVRKSLGVSFDGFMYQERFHILSTFHDFEKSHNFHYRTYCAHPVRWNTAMKVPGETGKGIWRVIFPAGPDEKEEDISSDAWIKARFDECLPGYDYPIVHRNLYSLSQRVAERFAVGRIALAGDAAHVNNPVGGMGMNSGFQDAINLAGKLVQIWHGAEAKPLLDRYDRQRRLTAIEYVQAQSMANKKTLEENDPKVRQANLEALRRRAADPVTHLEHVRRASLITMWHKSESIE